MKFLDSAGSASYGNEINNFCDKYFKVGRLFLKNFKCIHIWYDSTVLTQLVHFSTLTKKHVKVLVGLATGKQTFFPKHIRADSFVKYTAERNKWDKALSK